jgi:hypothetical protein
MTFSEFLDLPEFSGPAYESTMTAYLREKHAPAAALHAVVALLLTWTSRTA